MINEKDLLRQLSCQLRSDTIFDEAVYPVQLGLSLLSISASEMDTFNQKTFVTKSTISTRVIMPAIPSITQCRVGSG
jgi:hypothetical protein